MLQSTAWWGRVLRSCYSSFLRCCVVNAGVNQSVAFWGVQLLSGSFFPLLGDRSSLQSSLLTCPSVFIQPHVLALCGAL